MTGPDAWLPIAISGAALAVSCVSAFISYLSYRASGSRVEIQSHRWGYRGEERWLQIKLANQGRAEVAIEGAWANWLGSSVSNLPYQLKGGASHSLIFRGVLPPAQYARGPLVIQVGLGNGRTILKRINFKDNDLMPIKQANVITGEFEVEEV
ncbi:hypothetical protein [Sphaerisporangium aureirubrum]|uniref:Uncharacterized protein n=1 Tax=Sphaerisporangium aureirubrum TaxID=1544736 RepID=A0ABW1NG12_9ACTN